MSRAGACTEVVAFETVVAVAVVAAAAVAAASLSAVNQRYRSTQRDSVNFAIQRRSFSDIGRDRAGDGFTLAAAAAVVVIIIEIFVVLNVVNVPEGCIKCSAVRAWPLSLLVV